RDHLRAEENVNQSLLERRQHAGMAAGPAHGVAVHAADDAAGELLLDLLLQFLGAQPLVSHGGLIALGAALGGRLLVTAVVAKQDRTLAVKRQGHVAVLAALDMAAAGTQDVRGIAPAIEQ